MKRIAVFLAALTALSAQAIEYTQVHPDISAINFTYQQMGVKMDGNFRKFAAQLNFDPAKPAAAKAVFDIELASIDAGSSDADQEVAGKAWFNTKAFPTARFVATKVTPVGGNRYDVHFEPIADFSAIGPKEREDAIRRALETYVRVLGKHVRSAPHNWFNFFDFWAPARQD